MRGSSRSIAALAVAGVLLAATARRAAADAGTGAGPAGGPERITSFDSDVGVAEDGALHVRETVRVRSAGVVFKHGLERRFPVRYTGPLGGRVEVGFQVEGALRDGAPAPFTVRRAGRDKVIRIGDPSVLLEPGQHVFELTYVTTRQLGFFRDHDELYWNAVGTEWRVPIDAATATVTLPPAARGLARAPVAYVGHAGSRERADRADLRPMGAAFAAGRPLGAGEGMTIVVEWPKGAIAAPSAGTQVSWWLHDNPESAIALAGIAALLLLVRVARARLVGQRAPGGGPASMAADGTPRPAVSPVLLRYIVKREFDARSLPVAIMDMAERGCVTVHQGAHFALERTDKPLDLLPSEEQSAARTLFDGRQRVELAPSDRQWLGAASAALKWDLDQRGESYVTDGHGPAIVGLGLALAIVMAALGAATRDGILAVMIGGWFGAWAIALCALAAFLRSLVMGWMGRSLVGGARADTSATTAGIAVVFTLGVAIMVFAIAQYLATHELSPLGVVLLGGVAVCGYRALRLWRVRTAAGEELFAQARDLTRSMGGAMHARPAGAGAERLLAYALALDAVAAWEASVSKLAGDGSGGDPAGGFHWLYRDRDWERNHLRTGWPLASFADGFSSAVTASTGPAPGTSPGGASGGSSGGWSDSSSSSSSDSGGSSGGGGGGGGGGGW